MWKDAAEASVCVDCNQVVTSEILMASEMPSCPIEVSKIPISRLVDDDTAPVYEDDVCRCDETYDANCDGETTMPFYRAQYDAKTGQSPNMPRYLCLQML